MSVDSKKAHLEELQKNEPKPKPETAAPSSKVPKP